MTKLKGRALLRAVVIVLLECALALLCGWLTALSKCLGGAAHFIVLWLLEPLSGAVAAYLATARGLNNYLAWLAPPAFLYLAWYFTWTYAIEPGPAFVCALLSIIGAAAGDVVKKSRKKK